MGVEGHNEQIFQHSILQFLFWLYQNSKQWFQYNMDKRASIQKSYLIIDLENLKKEYFIN